MGLHHARSEINPRAAHGYHYNYSFDSSLYGDNLELAAHGEKLPGKTPWPMWMDDEHQVLHAHRGDYLEGDRSAGRVSRGVTGMQEQALLARVCPIGSLMSTIDWKPRRTKWILKPMPHWKPMTPPRQPSWVPFTT